MFCRPSKLATHLEHVQSWSRKRMVPHGTGSLYVNPERPKRSASSCWATLYVTLPSPSRTPTLGSRRCSAYTHPQNKDCHYESPMETITAIMEPGSPLYGRGLGQERPGGAQRRMIAILVHGPPGVLHKSSHPDLIWRDDPHSPSIS